MHLFFEDKIKEFEWEPFSSDRSCLGKQKNILIMDWYSTLIRFVNIVLCQHFMSRNFFMYLFTCLCTNYFSDVTMIISVHIQQNTENWFLCSIPIWIVYKNTKIKCQILIINARENWRDNPQTLAQDKDNKKHNTEN
jgi:hypothetical protein